SVFETALLVTPVALCFATTSAPGTTPPLASTTTPDNVDVVPPWPKLGSASARKTTTSEPRTRTSPRERCAIPSSCHFKPNTQRSLWLPCGPSRQIVPDPYTVRYRE